MARWLVLVEVETDSDEQPDIRDAAQQAELSLRLGETPYNVIRHPEEA